MCRYEYTCCILCNRYIDNIAVHCSKYIPPSDRYPRGFCRSYGTVDGFGILSETSLMSTRQPIDTVEIDGQILPCCIHRAQELSAVCVWCGETPNYKSNVECWSKMCGSLYDLDFPPQYPHVALRKNWLGQYQYVIEEDLDWDIEVPKNVIFITKDQFLAMDRGVKISFTAKSIDRGQFAVQEIDKLPFAITASSQQLATNPGFNLATVHDHKRALDASMIRRDSVSTSTQASVSLSSDDVVQDTAMEQTTEEFIESLVNSSSPIGWLDNEFAANTDNTNVPLNLDIDILEGNYEDFFDTPELYQNTSGSNTENEISPYQEAATARYLPVFQPIEEENASSGEPEFNMALVQPLTDYTYSN